MNELQVREYYKQITMLLIERELTISTMESMTAGLIASLITDTEGSSAVFTGAYVTYSNEAKIKNGVSAKTIENYGVYSAQTASEMAFACKTSYHADIGIGVTGTAGNLDESNRDSTIGRVYCSIHYKSNIYDFCFDLLTMETRYEYKLLAAEKIAEALLDIILTA